MTRPDFSINVRPHPHLVGKAFADYVKKVRAGRAAVGPPAGRLEVLGGAL
jgi:hypothetical protein